MSRVLKLAALSSFTGASAEFGLEFHNPEMMDAYSLKIAAQDFIPDVGEALAEVSARREENNPFNKDGDDKCKKCVMGTTKCVMEYVFTKVDKKCSKLLMGNNAITIAEEIETFSASNSALAMTTTTLTTEVSTMEDMLEVEVPTADYEEDLADPNKRKEYFCKFWKNEKEVAEGFLVAMVRPMMDSYFYCLGSKDCNGKENILEDPEVSMMGDGIENAIGDLESLKTQFEELGLDWHSDHHHHDDDDDDEEWESDDDEKWEKIKALKKSIAMENWEHLLEEKMAGRQLHASSEEHQHGGWGIVDLIQHIKKTVVGDDDDDEEHKKGKGKGKGDDHKKGKGKGKDDDHKKGKGKGKKGHVCVKCYKKVFKMVMKIAVIMTMKVCGNTKCPFMQHWCKWAGDHKKMAFGMLMGRVEPWKYAIGRCYKRGGGKGAGKGGKGKGREEPMLRASQPLKKLLGAPQEEPVGVQMYV